MSINYLFMSNKLTTVRLEEVLKEHEIELKDFLGDMGISQPNYKHWSERDVPSYLVPKIAEHLEISIDELMGRTTPESKSVGLPPKILKAAKRLSQIPEQQKDHVIGIIESLMPKKNEAQPGWDTERLGRIIDVIDQSELRDQSARRRAEKIDELYNNQALKTRADFTAEIIKLSSRR